MRLTPGVKFIIIAFAFIVHIALWIWTGIKDDAFALGMSEHWYNIGLVIISAFVTAAGALVGYLGIRTPIFEQSLREDEPRE